MTAEMPADIRKLIEDHITGFNTQDDRLLASVFSDTGIVIDGIAPYRWLNPGAPAKWLADVAIWRQNLGVVDEKFAYEIGFWNVEGSHAYVVLDGTLTVTLKDQSIVRTGTLAYAFTKYGDGWKIDAQAWGRTS